jgi:hypothetical protein
MLANLLFGSVMFYGAFTWANPPWTFLSLLEAVIVGFVTITGLTKCYFASGGDSNDQFAKQFNCLSFGAWFWTTLGAWSVFWLVVWLFRVGAFTAARFENIGLAHNLATIGGSFLWLWTLLATVLWQVFYFAWLRSALEKANSAT